MNRSIAALLFTATVDRVILQGIYPVLPVMVASRGVAATNNGMFMAVVYVAIALGSWLTPRILELHPSVGKVSVVLSLLTGITLLAMGYSVSYPAFLLSTAAYWFLCGVQVNIYSVLMSFISPPERIGSNFGLLANTTLIGAVLGGLAIGPCIKMLGGHGAFALFALATVATRLLLLLPQFDVAYARHSVKLPPLKISSALWLFLILFNAGIMLSFIGRFNLSLVMKDLHYDIDAISRLFAWGALAVLPLPYLFGLLSQRMPPKWLLVISLSSVTLAMWILYTSSSYSAFFWAGFLICIMTYCSRGVAQKIVYDMYSLAEQKRAQSLLASANWVAAIFGFALVSLLSSGLSLSVVSLACCVLGAVVSIGLLFSKLR
jgi:MFS family permease